MVRVVDEVDANDRWNGVLLLGDRGLGLGEALAGEAWVCVGVPLGHLLAIA